MKKQTATGTIEPKTNAVTKNTRGSFKITDLKEKKDKKDKKERRKSLTQASTNSQSSKNNSSETRLKGKKGSGIELSLSKKKKKKKKEKEISHENKRKNSHSAIGGVTNKASEIVNTVGHWLKGSSSSSKETFILSSSISPRAQKIDPALRAGLLNMIAGQATAPKSKEDESEDTESKSEEEFENTEPKSKEEEPENTESGLGDSSKLIETKEPPVPHTKKSHSSEVNLPPSQSFFTGKPNTLTFSALVNEEYELVDKVLQEQWEEIAHYQWHTATSVQQYLDTKSRCTHYKTSLEQLKNAFEELLGVLNPPFMKYVKVNRESRQILALRTYLRNTILNLAAKGIITKYPSLKGSLSPRDSNSLFLSSVTFEPQALKEISKMKYNTRLSALLLPLKITEITEYGENLDDILPYILGEIDKSSYKAAFQNLQDILSTQYDSFCKMQKDLESSKKFLKITGVPEGFESLSMLFEACQGKSYGSAVIKDLAEYFSQRKKEDRIPACDNSDADFYLSSSNDKLITAIKSNIMQFIENSRQKPAEEEQTKLAKSLQTLLLDHRIPDKTLGCWYT